MMEVETNSKQRIVSKSGKQGQSASISHREKLKTAHDLTDAQISAFREIFEYLDVDLSGHITDEELLCRTQQLGINITQKEVKDAMDAIPLDVNGEIDFEGFLKYMTCNQRYDEAITTSSDVDKVIRESLNVILRV